MATNYDIDYSDKRFTQVETEKQQALSENEKLYAGMIDSSDKYYQAQIDASKQWAEKQSQLQQEKTDFAIEQIEQQKEQTKKDYIKEQSGAYGDWIRQSDPYGVNAEQAAAQGLKNTGWSESSQVRMYTAYQNRVATARESYNNAVLNYNNSIKDAQLQNNSALAEIAYQALQQQLELSLQGFQYKNQLLLDKANAKTTIENNYYTRYQDVLQQINHENALAEEVRQYNASLAQQQAALAEETRQFDEEMAYKKAKDAAAAAAKINKTNSQPSSSTTRSTYVKKQTADEKKLDNVKGGSKKSSSAEIDMQSVLALGYGPISAAKLSSLVDSGVIEQYTSGGKIKFRKSASTLKQQMLFR